MSIFVVTLQGIQKTLSMFQKRRRGITAFFYICYCAFCVGGPTTDIETVLQRTTTLQTTTLLTSNAMLKTTQPPLKNQSFHDIPLQTSSTESSCPSGSFQDLSLTPGTINPDFCAPGLTSASNVAVSDSKDNDCALCEAGTYKDVFGTIPCFPCPAGTFSATRGATCNLTCLRCPPHSMSFISGSVSCDCEAGFDFVAGPAELEIPSPATRSPWQESRLTRGD